MNIHTNLHNLVSEAVVRIAHMETSWKQTEVTRRIVRYIFNAAKSPELFSLPWREATKKLVVQSMNGYCAACQEKPWFYEIDLVPALTSAAWELVCARGMNVRDEQLQDLVEREYEEVLDRTMLQKAMWESTDSTFSDSVVRTKVYNALSRAYHPAFDECIVDTRPRSGKQKAEMFMKRWITDSMARAWSAVENPQQTLSTSKVVALFQKLVAPFGDDHGFSCIPTVLTEKLGGPPPADWEYIDLVVEQLFATWKQESSVPSSSSRKRKPRSSAAAASSVEDAEMEDLPPPAAAKATRHSYEGSKSSRTEGAFNVFGSSSRRASPPEHRIKAEVIDDEGDTGGDPPEGGGHPDCTSVEDCIGSRRDNLVRHMLADEQGDMYCETCWESFLDQNPHLEGIWEDGEFANAPYATRR